LEHLCLAEFVASFTFKGKGSFIEREGNVEGDDEIADDENDAQEGEEIDVCEVNQQHKIFAVDGGTLHRRNKLKVIRFCRFDLHKDPANFYRERVMLFVPWRDEKNEVELADCTSIFCEWRELIENNSRKFIRIDLDLNEVYDQLEQQRNIAEDNEEPGQNNVEVEDEDVNVYDYDDNVIMPDISLELGEQNCSSIETKKYTVPDQLCDKKFYELCDSLNEKQRDYLMHLLNEFKTTDKEIYHFISGGAGVGKSCLIKAIYQALMRFFRSTPGPVENPEVLIVSYTGKAAHNVGGMTAHAAFSLTIAQNGETMKNLGHESLNTIRVKTSKLKLVIIDEISMMGVRTFTQIHRRLSQITGLTKPFGGISIIAVGDFNQLKPVKEGYVFSSDGQGCNSILGNPLWNNFVLYELDEIMRQRDDLRFAQSLGRLATGILTQDDVNLFKSRCYKTEDDLPEEGKKAVRLIKTNNDIAIYNERKMQQLSSSLPMIVTFVAKDRVIDADSETDKRQALHNLKDLPAQKTQGLPEILKLQVGVRYMVTSNIDVADGIFNGATGILRMIEIVNGKPFAIYLEFDDENVGKVARCNRQSIMEAIPTIQPNWTPIQRIKGQFTVTRRRIKVIINKI
jgi:DNA replication protein DnaC